MKEWAYKWAKLIIENSFISKNKWLILLLIGGLTAGGAQEFRYWNYAPKQKPIKSTEKPVDTAAIVDMCKKYTDRKMINHLRRFHP